MTHWSLAGGRGCEVVNFIDDHSRLCLRSVAGAVTTALDVGEAFQQARAACFRIRHDKIDRHGKLSLRYDSRLFHIGIGARYKDRPVVRLIADRDVRVVSAEDGALLRHLTLDPTRNYQRQSA